MLNATKILEYALRAKETICSEAPTEIIINLRTTLDKIIDLCRQELLEQSAKELGGASLVKRVKAAQKILSRIDDDMLKQCGAVTRTLPNGMKVQTFSTKHFGFMLNAELPGLPQGAPSEAIDIPKMVESAENFMEKHKEVYIDLIALKVFIAEHKAFNKGKKNAPPPVWETETQIYDAEYLIDCYTILGKDAKLYQDLANPLGYALLIGEYGKGVLAPMRRNS